jgi:hypothetical protein
VADGNVVLTNVSISGGNGADGVRVGLMGSADISFATIADNTGVGVDNSQGGTVTIDRSIVYDNAMGDLDTVPCDNVGFSDTGTPDCSSVNDNISADPLLDVDFRLTDGSPCLDTGPDPSTYTGDPPTDLDGGPRLRDHDGDGSANSDCGAYEKANTALAPGEVMNLHWPEDIFKETLEWDAEPSAVEYHVYRQDPTTLSYADFATCADGLDPDRTDTQLVDTDVPAGGAVFGYLVTAEDAGGNEGTLGLSTGAERSNFTPCP